MNVFTLLLTSVFVISWIISFASIEAEKATGGCEIVFADVATGLSVRFVEMGSGALVRVAWSTLLLIMYLPESFI